MKKLLLMVLCLAIVVLSASMVWAFGSLYTPGVGINNTVHDIPVVGYAPADPNARICIYCHAPHNSIKLSVANGGNPLGGGGAAAPDQYDYLPLWNHQLTLQTYDMYYNGPGEPAAGAHRSQAIDLFSSLGSTGPGGISLLCLSCHDGTIAVNAYGMGYDGSAPTQPSGSYPTGASSTIDLAYQIGGLGNLQNHHPVGFSYTDARTGGGGLSAADSELRNETTTNMNILNGTNVTIAEHLYTGSGASLSRCTSNCMECGTCHSVHNKGNSGERLLWRSDNNSRLCLTCHDKGTYYAPGTGTPADPTGPAI